MTNFVLKKTLALKLAKYKSWFKRLFDLEVSQKYTAKSLKLLLNTHMLKQTKLYMTIFVIYWKKCRNQCQAISHDRFKAWFADFILLIFICTVHLNETNNTCSFEVQMRGRSYVRVWILPRMLSVCGRSEKILTIVGVRMWHSLSYPTTLLKLKQELDERRKIT